MECRNLRTSHQWLKRKKHSTSKLGAECFIFLCCIFWFVLHWKAECCISWFCVANIFQFVATNEWSVAKKKSNVAIKKSALRLYHFVSPLPVWVLITDLSYQHSFSFCDFSMQEQISVCSCFFSLCAISFAFHHLADFPCCVGNISVGIYSTFTPCRVSAV